MGDEVGASVGSTKKTSGFVIGPGCLFCSLEGAKPHSYLLCCVLDLCDPSPRRSLPHTNKLVGAIAGVVASVPSLEFASFNH